jgi:sugar lactone lactonase YvrE
MLNSLPSLIGGVVLAVVTLSPACAYAQAGAAPNSQPNPYHVVEKWAQLPNGRTWGSVSAVHVDSKDHIWVADKCGTNSCVGRTEDPIFEFDSSGKVLKSFGSGMFVAIHGIFVDKDGNVWVTDYVTADGKGQQVTKFSPDGKLLLKLGKAGVARNGPDTLNQPTDVAVAPNGDIFVSEGHGGEGDARILKFSKSGKFIKTWGKKGSAPGEFNIPHALAFDSRGRLFVGDRANNRIQIFDQEGNFLAEWRQFGRPSGLFIDRNDTLYVADSESNPVRNPGFLTGIRVGSAKDGSVRAFLPIRAPDPNATAIGTEGVAADSKGTIYGGETSTMDLKAYAKE